MTLLMGKKKAQMRVRKGRFEPARALGVRILKFATVIVGNVDE